MNSRSAIALVGLSVGLPASATGPCRILNAPVKQIELPPGDHGFIGKVAGPVFSLGIPHIAPFTAESHTFQVTAFELSPDFVTPAPPSDVSLTLFPGEAVLHSGYAVVADPEYYVNGTLTKGRLYELDLESATLKSPFPAADDWTGPLGYALDSDSATSRVIAGAPLSKRDADSPIDEGSALIYRRLDSDEWVEEAHLWNPGGGKGDRHGWSVAIAGDVAAVGAYGINNYGGAVCIYRFDGEQWAFETQIDSPWGGQGFFGRALDLDASGNVLAVGAPNSYQQNGAVYVFEHNGEAWSLAHTLQAEEPAGVAPALGNFGLHISDRGTLIVASAPSDAAPGFEAGAFHIFQKQGLEYLEVSKIVSPEPVGNGVFSAQGLDGDKVAAGQWRRNNIGGAYLYRGVLGLDCNNNGLTDACEVHDGLAEDANFNFIPDECELIGDLDADGLVGSADLNLLLAGFGTTIAYWEPALPADIDNSLTVDTADLNLLLQHFGDTAERRGAKPRG